MLSYDNHLGYANRKQAQRAVQRCMAWYALSFTYKGEPVKGR